MKREHIGGSLLDPVLASHIPDTRDSHVIYFFFSGGRESENHKDEIRKGLKSYKAADLRLTN